MLSRKPTISDLIWIATATTIFSTFVSVIQTARIMHKIEITQRMIRK